MHASRCRPSECGRKRPLWLVWEIERCSVSHAIQSGIMLPHSKVGPRILGVTADKNHLYLAHDYSGAATLTAKQEIQKIIRSLPSSCSFEDVQHHLYLAAKVRRAAKSIDEGRGI